MKKLLLIPLVLLFVISLANAQLLIKELTFADATTSSDTYVTVDSDNFFINKTADITALVSLEAELVAGAGVCTNCRIFYRILIDNEVITETSAKTILTAQSRNSIVLIGNKILDVGTHTLELQHKVPEDNLFTHDISAQIISNILSNTSFVNHFTFRFKDIELPTFAVGFVELLSRDFIVTEISDIQLISAFLQNITSSGSSVPSEFFYEIDNKVTPIFKQHLVNRDTTIGNNDIITNVSTGLHTIKMFGRSLVGAKALLSGDISLTQLSNDGIEIRHSREFHDTITNVLSGQEINLLNASLVVQPNSDILVMATANVLDSGGLNALPKLKFQLNGVDSVTKSVSFYTTNHYTSIFLSHVFVNLTGNNTVLVFGEATGGDIQFENITLNLIQVNDYDTNIIIPPNQFKAAQDRSINDTPFLIKKLDFADSFTVSSTYESIGSFQFNINISDTNGNFFANLEAELTAVATDGSGIASWRILVDGETISEVNREFIDTSNGDIGSVVIFGQKQNLAVGSHSVELQHKVTGEQINSRDITFFINQDTLSNNSRIERNLFSFDISYSATSFVEIGSGNFTTNVNQNILSIINLNVTLPSVERQEYFYELDGIATGHFKRLVNQLPETINLGYSHIFENVAAGFHTWRVFARNTPSTASTSTGSGRLSFFQGESDGLTINSNFLLIEEQRNITDVFLEISRLELDVANQSDIVVLISGTFDTNTTDLSVNRNTLIDFEIRTPVGSSVIRNINLLGSNGSDTGKRFYNFFFSDIFENFNLGRNNISLFVKASPEKLNIINLTFSIFEVEDYDLSIQVPIFPVVNIIAPSNNTRNNTHPINITFIASNDAAISLDCTLRNESTVFDQGTFLNNVTSNLLLDTGLIEIDQRFDLEIICFDNGVIFNLSSSAFLSNLTLDNIDPIITIISPLDLEKFNKDITGSININAECSDTPVFKFNITITNATDTIFSVQDTTPIGNKITIDQSLDITDIGIGTYTVDYLCSDPHTSSQIDNYNIQKNTSENKIKWISPTLNEYELKYSVPAKNGINATDFGTYKNDFGDRYIFYYIMDAVDDGTERTFTFELENKKQEVHYISDSGYKAHFVMENNWIDFEFNDPDATYLVTLNGNGNYEIEITTTKTILNFSSTGELNTATLQTTFSIDFKKQIRVSIFSIGSCPLENLQTTILFIFFILLSFLIMSIGFSWRIGIVGAFGSLLLIILSVFAYACVIAVGIVLTGLGMILFSFFVIKGTRNFV